MAYLSLLFFGFYEKKNGRKGILRRERVFFWGEVRAKTQGLEVFFKKFSRRHRATEFLLKIFQTLGGLARDFKKTFHAGSRS